MRTWRMAWRNIWRNRRRTAATTAALTLALLFSFLYSALATGLMANMERDALDFELGDVQVTAAGYDDRPSLYTHLVDAARIVSELERRGVPATARLLGAGLAAAGDASAGVQLRGVDVAADRRVLLLHEQLSAGAWLTDEDPTGIVLGRRLAGTLAVTPGDEVVVLSQAADGSIANQLYRVRGVLRTVGEATDRVGLLMTAAAFRELMAFPNGAHQIIARRPPTASLADVAGIVGQIADGHVVKTWREVNPVLATYIDSTRGLLNFIFVIFYVVVAIVVLNAMLMAVFERIRELGVLKALGAGPASILALIYLESMLQVGLAIIVALALSGPLLWYLATVGLHVPSLAGVSVMGLAMTERWIALPSAATFVTPTVLLGVVVSLAVLYPAGKAALIPPLAAMRHH